MLVLVLSAGSVEIAKHRERCVALSRKQVYCISRYYHFGDDLKVRATLQRIKNYPELSEMHQGCSAWRTLSTAGAVVATIQSHQAGTPPTYSLGWHVHGRQVQTDRETTFWHTDTWRFRPLLLFDLILDVLAILRTRPCIPRECDANSDI